MVYPKQTWKGNKRIACMFQLGSLSLPAAQSGAELHVLRVKTSGR